MPAEMPAQTAIAAPNQATSPLIALKSVYDLVANDFAAVNQLIPAQLTSDVDLVEEISQYIVESGGKRLRPLLVLLAARCCGYEGAEHVKLAAIIEFLHTATLLHDDVVDHSVLRRGRATANATWGNAPSVLVGDFLYSRAFQLMVELGQMDIMAILSDATNTIAEGEVMQLANVGNCQISEAEYMEVIRCKTALLFEASTHTAAVLASQDGRIRESLKRFGEHFGLAYQLVDDWLDYAGESESMGKNVGDDLAEGKLTLPLINALALGNESDRALLGECISARSVDALPDVLRIVRSTGALDYTKATARQQSETAIGCLETLPANAHRDAPETPAHFATARLN
ncbi:MAG: octaprenyl diphosphate synthase [Gammaproteobacteria bacterium]|nr:MAG: octaprenyl diphosphate synthase [Gammaproteobacteria bacterium]